MSTAKFNERIGRLRGPMSRYYDRKKDEVTQELKMTNLRDQLTRSIAATEQVDNLLLAFRLNLADMRDSLNDPDQHQVMRDNIDKIFAGQAELLELTKALSPWRFWPAEAAE